MLYWYANQFLQLTDIVANFGTVIALIDIIKDGVHAIKQRARGYHLLDFAEIRPAPNNGRRRHPARRR